LSNKTLPRIAIVHDAAEEIDQVNVTKNFGPWNALHQTETALTLTDAGANVEVNRHSNAVVSKDSTASVSDSKVAARPGSFTYAYGHSEIIAKPQGNGAAFDTRVVDSAGGDFSLKDAAHFVKGKPEHR